LDEDKKSLVLLSKRMKKTGISVDIVAFGELGEDTINKLQAFSENCQSNEGSHLAIIQPSSNLLSDSLVTTPILGGDGSAGGAAASGSGGDGGEAGGNQWEFGVDPSVDPELALALRMSYEEEKARQERERKAKEAAEGKSELEQIPEGDEKQPLLGEDGQPSGSASGSGKQRDNDKDDDKMDTA
jgi:26S proteasome regulatory subunit N10